MLRSGWENFARAIGVIAIGTGVWGCGDGSRKPEPTLRGTAAVGAPVAGARVRARCANGSGFNSSVTTDAQGRFTADVAVSALPCALQVSGGSLPAGLALHSFASAKGTINVTPLTDLILALASGQTPAEWYASEDFAAAADELATALAQLRQALVQAGFSVPDGDPFSTSFEAQRDDPWDELLEQLQQAIEQDPERDDYGDLVELVRQGKLDVLPAAPAEPDADGGAPGDDDGGEPELDGAPGEDPDGGVEPDPDAGMDMSDASAGDTVPGTVHAALVGTHMLTFRVGGGAGCGSACAFTDNQRVSVVVGADGSLMIAGKTLTSPYHRVIAGTPHLPEIIWRDGDLEYALSDNATGTFNEINVGNLAASQNGFPQFLGQLNKLVVGDNTLVVQFAGSYGVSRTYKGDAPAWTSLTIGQDGSFSFSGGAGPNVTAAQIGEVLDRQSCCGRVDVRLTFDLDGDGTVDGSDRINLFSMAGGGLKDIVYPTSGESNDDVGVTVAAIDPLPAHTGAAIPDDNRFTGTVSGSALSIPIDADPVANTSSLTLGASMVNSSSVLEQQWLLRMELVSAPQTGQIYDCHEYASSASGRKTIRLNLKAKSGSTSTDYSSQNGGRCQVTIVSVEIGGPTNSSILAVQARFVAELFPSKRDVAPIVINDGVLRWAR